MKDKTKEILARMLCENTGKHFLDSGGVGNRAWQRNNKAIEAKTGESVENLSGEELVNVFQEREETFCNFSINHWRGEDHLEIEIVHDAFHWLAGRLYYEPDMQARYDDFVKDRRDTSHLLDMEDFAAALDGRAIYGEGDPVSVNTYNGECLLSATLQYLYFSVDEGDFIALQIHGGADVRGGYTAPKLFSVQDECALFDNARANLWAENTLNPKQMRFDGGVNDDSHSWYTDDGCNFYGDGAAGDLSNYPCADDMEKRGKGFVVVDEDGNGYSPLNGSRLFASA